MRARTKRAAVTGAKVGGIIGAVRGGGSMMHYYAAGGKSHATGVGIGAATVVTHAAFGAGVGAGVSAYRQHKENAHLHNFHKSAKAHTM